MMKVKDITQPLEEFAPLSLQEAYDNSGLIVGRPDDEVRGGVLLAVDITEEVIKEALALDCSLIITHHPIIFHALKRFNSASLVERCVEKAIKHDIALYACHTNLDSAHEGMSWRLGHILGVENMTTLDPATEKGVGAGFGVVGELPQPQSLDEVLALIRKRLNVSVIRHSAPISRQIRRIAICTGAGGSLMEAARHSACDLYITADLKYNDFYAPDSQFVVADIGHFESEFCAIQILFDILSKKITNFALHKSAQAQNPIYYNVR